LYVTFRLTIAYASHPVVTLARFGDDVNAAAVNTATEAFAALVLVAQPDIEYVGSKNIYPVPDTNEPDANVTAPPFDAYSICTTPTYAAVSLL
jgi:hypothetical protein